MLIKLRSWRLFPNLYVADPDNQSFTAWAVYSRPVTQWPHENIDTGLTGVDENPAAIALGGDEIIVQGAEKLYSSKDGPCMRAPTYLPRVQGGPPNG